VAAIQRALLASDVIGISHYAPSNKDNPARSTFEVPINTCAHELRAWGINLRSLIIKRQFLFSEVGLGGGNRVNQ
jgi:hypothetical protein